MEGHMLLTWQQKILTKDQCLEELLGYLLIDMETKHIDYHYKLGNNI